MGNLDKGWIRVDRRLKDHWLWNEKPVTRVHAWLDLLLSVNHSDKDILFDGAKLTVKRGSMVTSVRKLSVQWGWSRDKTLRFLRELEKDGMITRIADTRKTTVTIVNYEKFQNPSDSQRTTKKTLTDHRPTTDPSQTIHYKTMNNNEKQSDLLPEEEQVGYLITDDDWEG